MINYLHCENGFSEINNWEPGCWVNVVCPSEEELSLISEKFQVPADFLDDLADADERPRVERNDGWILTVVRIPLFDEKGAIPYSTIPLGVMQKGDFIISLCYFNNELTPDFILHTQKRNINISYPSDFVLRVLNSTAYWYLNYLKMLHLEIQENEAQLRQSVENEDLLDLMSLQKSLLLFATSVKGDVMLTERLQRFYDKQIDPELLEDVEIEMRQADTTIDIITSMLDRTLDTYASVISNNVNTIMKRLTSISFSLMVPTLIASLYGMNVNIGISPSNKWAFWIIIATAFVLTAIVCLYLKKIKWL